MAITIERLDDEHWSIDCDDGEWKDIKKIMAYALENYDKHSALDHILPDRKPNEKKILPYEYFAEICEEIKFMSKPPQKIYAHGYFAIKTTIGFLSYPGRGTLSGVSQDRFDYFDREFNKPLNIEKQNTQLNLTGN